jgi:hypoxanthine-DNA glycosylase
LKSVGFEAIASRDARVLILGTLPGVMSLERGEYYAHPRNSFWWIMGKLVGAWPEIPYKNRLLQLRNNGIALWDVCHSAERSGSSDAKILLQTVETNDFRSFLSGHAQIQLICFNGQPAERIFRCKVNPMLVGIRAIPRRVLDSTSPAHAIKAEEKLSRWRSCIESLINACHS